LYLCPYLLSSLQKLSVADNVYQKLLSLQLLLTCSPIDFLWLFSIGLYSLDKLLDLYWVLTMPESMQLVKDTLQPADSFTLVHGLEVQGSFSHFTFGTWLFICQSTSNLDQTVTND